MKFTFLACIVCFLLFACNKNTSAKQTLLDCNNSKIEDSATTATKILGSWHWVQVRSGGNGEVAAANKNVVITFNSDSTFTVQEEDVITTQGSWKLSMFSNDAWELDLSQSSPYLYGFISFCDNKVLFTASYFDGSDNLFEKIN